MIFDTLKLTGYQCAYGALHHDMWFGVNRCLDIQLGMQWQGLVPLPGEALECESQIAAPAWLQCADVTQCADVALFTRSAIKLNMSD